MKEEERSASFESGRDEVNQNIDGKDDVHASNTSIQKESRKAHTTREDIFLHIYGRLPRTGR